MTPHTRISAGPRSAARTRVLLPALVVVVCGSSAMTAHGAPVDEPRAASAEVENPRQSPPASERRSIVPEGWTGARTGTGASTQGESARRQTAAHGGTGAVGGGNQGSASPSATGWGVLVSIGWPLAVVLAAILGAVWVLKRAAGLQGGAATLAQALGPGGRAPAGLLEILGRYPIGRGQTLVVMKFDQRVLLVAHTVSAKAGASWAVLSELTEPSEVASVLLKSRDEAGESAASTFREAVAELERAEFAPNGDAIAPIAGRRVIRDGGDGLDRAELWDDRATLAPDGSITSVDRAGGARGSSGGDLTARAESFEAVRSRLAALRGGRLP